jgi:hypothetical protein
VFTKRGLLTKCLTLVDGRLQKNASGCAMGKGAYRRVAVAGLSGLDALLSGLTPQEAVAYGVAPAEQARVVAKRDAAHHPDAITRTRDVFAWPSPAVMMLD